MKEFLDRIERWTKAGWDASRELVVGVGGWVLTLVREINAKSQGKTTYGWCIVAAVVCLLWIVYHPPAWAVDAVRACGVSAADPDGGGNGSLVTAMATIGVSLAGAIAGVRRNNATNYRNIQDQLRQDAYYRTLAKTPNLDPPGYGWEGNGGQIPGDDQWQP